MNLGRTDIFSSLFLFAISLLFVADIFFSPGRPAAFDMPFHITSIAQFHAALAEGDFPVVWTDGFANYGLPISIVAHQFTSYAGGILTFLTNDPVLSFSIVAFMGVFLSSLFTYLFLRLYFPLIPSFAGSFLFTFSTYRIINFYIRGAMPELFSGVFLPLILIGMYIFIKKKKIAGFFLLAIALFLLTLSHPMMLLIYSLIYIPYLFFLLLTEDGKLVKDIFTKEQILLFISSITAMGIGVGMASYYLMPLLLEMKYFYFGLSSNHFNPGSFLGISDFFLNRWEYFTESEIFTRGHIIKPGVIEAAGVIAGLIYFIRKFLIKKVTTITILEYAVVVSLVVIFSMSALSEIFYTHISILSNIQFSWRMLSAFLFLPPIIYAFFFSKIKNVYLVFIFIFIVAILQFPQLYGKNYIIYPKEEYYFTPYNLHSIQMNTIWTGKAEEYPIQKSKPEIIEGEGRIVEKIERNSSRNYVIDAMTDIRMVDYTFYFPGWKVYVDGNDTPIEFQDPEYRGVITYLVPQGRHVVELVFEDTRIRLAGKIASVFFFSILITLFIFRKRLAELFLT